MSVPEKSWTVKFPIDRPQPFQYFAIATSPLQALTAPDFSHL